MCYAAQAAPELNIFLYAGIIAVLYAGIIAVHHRGWLKNMSLNIFSTEKRSSRVGTVTL
jgi:hypothetical protein